MGLKKMKNQSKQTIKVDYSPAVVSAIKAESTNPNLCDAESRGENQGGR